MARTTLPCTCSPPRQTAPTSKHTASALIAILCTRCRLSRVMLSPPSVSGMASSSTGRRWSACACDHPREINRMRGFDAYNFVEDFMAGQVKPIPQGYEGATPYLCVRSATEAIDFYKKAFGATEVMR